MSGKTTKAEADKPADTTPAAEPAATEPTGEAGSDNSTPAGTELVTPTEHAEAIETPIAIERDDNGAVLRGFDPELVGTQVATGVADLPHDEETAARSADMAKPSNEFLKVFVLGPGKYDSSTGYDHEPNKIATRQQAINSGLWPLGDVRFISNKAHDDGKSRVLSYGVDVAPAHDIVEGATHPEVSGQADVVRDDEGTITHVDDPSKPANAEPSKVIDDEPTA